LKPGDFVFAEDGSPTKVTRIFDNGVKPIYRVTFDDGSSTQAGAEHLWKVMGATERRKELGWAVLTTEEIIHRGVRNKNGRWAGRQFEMWLGDGTRKQNRYMKPDVEVERKINALGYKTYRSDEDMVTVHGWKIAELGAVADCHSYDRFIPEIYKLGSVEQRQELLRGLMDTDGCIGSQGSMEYATTSQRRQTRLVS
jgi:hypothetical protein